MIIPTESSATVPHRSSILLAVVYWLVVGIPLTWGVYQTVQKSIPLFSVTKAAVIVAPAGTGATSP